MDKTEAERRASFKDAVLAYFRLHESEWVPAATLMQVGGRMAWRTRISDARKVFRKEHGCLENRVQHFKDGTVLSEYRYLKYVPLARDSGERVTQKGLF